jgi:hypothetical protein
MTATRTTGITVMPEHFQVEGVEAVLDNLQRRACVTAIATAPYVMAPMPDGQGSGVPPIDAGEGSARLLDRPLWGRRESLARTAPSFVPDASLYRGLRYQPPAPDDLTRDHGRVVAATIRAAKARGMTVLLRVPAAMPPGHRVQSSGPVDEDRPRLPDGSTPVAGVDDIGSLASPHLHDFARARVCDLLQAYPEVDGLCIDGPEYPPSSLDDAFLDFGPHAEAAARGLGYDFAAMREAALWLRARLLGRLSVRDLTAWTERDGGRFRLLQALVETPALRDWLAFKSDLSTGLVRTFREALDAAAPGRKLVAGALPPPMTLASGFSFRRSAPLCDAIHVKLFTMHWAMMVRGWGEALRTANPSLAAHPALPRTLAALFDVVDDAGLDRLEDWRYPGPEESHPVGGHAQTRKIRSAQLEAGDTPVMGIAHGYGPLADFSRRLRIAHDAGRGSVWVDCYGHLADAKLDAIGAVVAQGAAR